MRKESNTFSARKRYALRAAKDLLYPKDIVKRISGSSNGCGVIRGYERG